MKTEHYRRNMWICSEHDRIKDGDADASGSCVDDMVSSKEAQTLW